MKATFRRLRVLSIAAFLFLPLFCTHAQTTTPTPPPTCTLTTTPATIPLGASTRLQWVSTNAQSGSITRIGNVPPSGIVSLLPSTVGKTTFVGTFSNDAGAVTCSATVTVTSGQPNSNSTGSYNPGVPDSNDTTGTGAQVPDATPYSGGSQTAEPTTYSVGSAQTVTPYTVDPNAFKTNPTQSAFTGTQAPNVTNTPGNNTLSSYLVPCGTPSSAGNGDYNTQSTSCTVCSFGQLIQNLINFMLLVAIPIAAGLFAWAGILRFTSNGDTGKIKKSTEIFKSVFIGFAIAVSGYLIVQTVLNAFLTDNTYSWRTLNCIGLARERNSAIPAIFQGLYTPVGTSGLTPTAGTGQTPGAIPASNPTGGGSPTPMGDIAAAALAYRGTNTSAGPDAGNLACAWAVNNVLTNAGIPTIDGNSVATMEQVLQGGRGTAVNQQTAQPGDIVVFGNMSHVGICMDVGCTRTLSNSSGSATFTSSYPPTQGSRFYNINR